MDPNRFRLTAALFLAATGLLLTAGAETEHQVTSSCDQGGPSKRLVHRLECGHGVIRVINSQYCNEGESGAAPADCMTPHTARNVKPGCDGRKSCELYTTPFCTPGSRLYFRTTFTCAEALTVVACEGSTAQLDCGLGHAIAIYGAAYGRRDQTTCSNGIDASQLPDVVRMQPATALVAQRCDGQSSCLVAASNAVFTDPCPGIYKFLEISYGCQRAEPEQQVMTICDQGDSWATIVHRLECGHGVIRVMDSQFCTKGESDAEPAGCLSPHTAENVKLGCDGRKSCELYMTGFCTPGPHAGQYLRSTFTCAEALTVVACEEAVARFNCGLGRAIVIYGAAYGRRDRTTCSFEIDPDELKNVDCLQPATALVAQRCDGQSSCLVKASNAMFTDPCPGIYKYLEISYGCQPPEAHA